MKILCQVDIDPSTLLTVYHKKPHIFPLIAAVLEGKQKGLLYSDNEKKNFFIVHKFGFADLIETEENETFDAGLYHFFSEKEFSNEKIRWYQVPQKWVDKLQNSDGINVQFGERIQCIHNSFDYIKKPYVDDNIYVDDISALNYESLESHFNLSLGSRFWSSRQQFLDHSFGIVVYKKAVPAVLCYACAIVDQTAEIDIFTQKSFRGEGLGKIAVAAFIEKCCENNIRAHWDCYSNNRPSFALAKHFHFDLYHTYTHAIIAK